jgi:hypothetical protein
MNERHIEYLGDGVYLAEAPGGVWLLANDNENPTDKIFLEYGVLDALNRTLNFWNSQNARGE